MLKQLNSLNIIKSILLPPVEGEIRHYKDGDYKFINNHWQKIKKEDKLLQSNFISEKLDTITNEKISKKYNLPEGLNEDDLMRSGDLNRLDLINRFRDILFLNSTDFSNTFNKEEFNILLLNNNNILKFLYGIGSRFNMEDIKFFLQGGKQNYTKEELEQYEGLKKNYGIEGYIPSPNTLKKLFKPESTDLKDFPDYYDKKIDKELWNFIDKDSINKINYTKLLDSFYKNNFNPQNPIKFLVDLLGGIKSKNIKIKGFDIYKSSSNNFKVELKTDKFRHVREIDFNKKILKAGLIDTVDVEKKEKGIGHKMFISLIKFAKDNNFEKFEIHAGGDYSTKTSSHLNQKMNGYEHWGKIGFDINKDIPEYLQFKNLIKNNPNFKDCEGILDLYSKEGGYDFWVKNGFPIEMNFDFNNKKQLDILIKYNNEYIKKFGL